MILVIAFSFALSEREPNPCNIRLANATLRTVNTILRQGKGPVMVLAQWEVAEALELLGYRSDRLYEVNPYQTRYLGSDGVIDGAIEVILSNPEITEVVLVAHKFLHLHKVKELAQRRHLTINTEYENLIGRIGYYRKSLQWWTRSPIFLLLYAILQGWKIRKGWSLWAGY